MDYGTYQYVPCIYVIYFFSLFLIGIIRFTVPNQNVKKSIIHSINEIFMYTYLCINYHTIAVCITHLLITK